MPSGKSNASVSKKEAATKKAKHLILNNITISNAKGNYVPRRDYISRVHFQSFYHIENFTKRTIIGAFLGLLFALELIFFVKSPGNYSTGIGAIVQGIARLAFTMMDKNNQGASINWTIYNLIYWLLYFIINIPLFIFAWKKVGKHFTILSIVFMASSSVFGFGISVLFPNIQNILVLGNTIPMGTYPGNDVTQSTNIFAQYGVNCVPFWYVPHNGGSSIDPKDIFDDDTDPFKAYGLFFYSVAHGLCCGLIISVLYIIGGSGGGTDFISFNLKNKGKSLGKVILITNLITTFTGCTLGSYIPCGIINSNGWSWQFLLSANTVASFFSSIIFVMVLNVFFPTKKFLRLEVYSEKSVDIAKALLAIKYAHSGTLEDVQGIDKFQKYSKLSTVCSTIEAPKVIELVRTIDNVALITGTRVDEIDGWYYDYRQGDTPNKPSAAVLASGK